MTLGGDPDPLRELRDALRSPIEDVDGLSFLLSSTLSTLGLHPTSLISSAPSIDYVKSVSRYLPTIQVSLLTAIVPTFLPSLHDKDRQFLQTFFVPSKESSNLALRRNIALTSYQTLTSLLSTKSITLLPREARNYVLETIGQLARYSVSDLYWAVWSTGTGGEEGSKEASARELGWEEAISALVGLPAKVGNAVGRWKTEGWLGDLPEKLASRYVPGYFARKSS
jgi:telomere length regulation protein